MMRLLNKRLFYSTVLRALLALVVLSNLSSQTDLDDDKYDEYFYDDAEVEGNSYVTFISSSTPLKITLGCQLWDDQIDSVYILIKIENLKGFYPLTKLDSSFPTSIPVYYYEDGRKFQEEYHTEKILYYNYESDLLSMILRVEWNQDTYLLHMEYMHGEIAQSFYLITVDTKVADVTCTYEARNFKTKVLNIGENTDSLNGPSYPTTVGKEEFHSRLKRSTYNNNLDDMKYVEIFLVCDQRLFKQLNSDVGRVIEHCMDLIQEVDTIFRRYNIRIVLDGIEIWNDDDKVNINKDGEETLKSFSHYIEEISISDHVHLLTSFQGFGGNVAGLAYVGLMCSLTYSTGLTTDFSSRSIYTTASILAHELGHNLGMNHDNEKSTYCACADRHCLMHSSMVYPPAKYFSSCSIDSVNELLRSDRLTCLNNEPITNYTRPNVCGNNIVEEGEQCDCGSKYFCTNPCCDSNTCMLTKGSECAHGECCVDCRIASNDTLCRDVTDDCDLKDYCDGEIAYCKNYHREDGSNCSNNGACHHGNCKSHDIQCNNVWGGNAKNADLECYVNVNRAGTSYGNCGVDEKTEEFQPCAIEHVKCGMLQCNNVQSKEHVDGWRKWYMTLMLNIDDDDHTCVVGKLAERQKADHG